MNAYLSLSTFGDVSAGLKELSTAGYKLAILSNGAPAMLEQVVKNAGIDRLLTHVISVDEVQTYKPSPRVYELAPKTLVLAPEAIGFISSNSWDIAGAMSFGLTTFWINRRNQPAEELGFPAHRAMGKLTELLPLLQSS